MLIEHVYNCSSNAADRLYVFPSFCHQHHTGNCLQPMLERLAISSPLFCLARRLRADKFQNKFHVGVKKAIRLCVRHVRQADEPFWRPAPAHVAHARSMLELFYYKRGLRTRADVADEEQATQEEKLRRERGAALLLRCCGDWKSRCLFFLGQRQPVSNLRCSS
jgi:hypothetical protein